MYCTMLVEVGIEGVQEERGPRAGMTVEEEVHPRNAREAFQGLCYFSHTIRLPCVPAETQPPALTSQREAAHSSHSKTTCEQHIFKQLFTFFHHF